MENTEKAKHGETTGNQRSEGKQGEKQKRQREKVKKKRQKEEDKKTETEMKYKLVKDSAVLAITVVEDRKEVCFRFSLPRPFPAFFGSFSAFFSLVPLFFLFLYATRVTIHATACTD